VRDRFEPQEAARVLSYLGLVFGMAPILGPIAGAALLLSADWRGSFFMLAILAGLIGVISYFFLDEVQPLTPRSQQRETLGAAFLAPMKDANFIRYTFVLSLGGAMMLTYVSQSPGLFIEGFGFDPQPLALIFALNAAGFIAVGQINARILRRAYFEIVLRRGLYAAVFFAALVFFFAFTSIGGVWAIGISLCLTISSLGFVFGNATVGGLSTQGARAGMALSLMGAISTITAALTMAAAGALHDGTPKAMASIILTCAAVASLALLWRGQAQLRFAASRAAVNPESEN
jgi:DHA1 family bicyclomycin/chloramphenicol resistance-like MFS transporter